MVVTINNNKKVPLSKITIRKFIFVNRWGMGICDRRNKNRRHCNGFYSYLFDHKLIANQSC
jgi:hypothetical protein